MALKEMRMKAIAAGERHCAAINSDGNLYIWGDNSHKQVGQCTPLLADLPAREQCERMDIADVYSLPVCVNDGGMLNINPPIKVKFTDVACGARFTMAVSEGGLLFSWGDAEGGVLGHGAEKVNCSIPTVVSPFDGKNRKSKVSIGDATVSVANNDFTVKNIACGSYHSVAITQAGKLFSWGRADGSQLGLGEGEQIEGFVDEDDYCVSSPHEIIVPSVSGWKQASCGEVHSCAVTKHGDVWSWGWGEFGQLGIGVSAERFPPGEGGVRSKIPRPSLIDPSNFEFSQIKQVSCGGAFTCALTEQGVLWSFGTNDCGQLGVPKQDIRQSDLPIRPNTLQFYTFTSVACGSQHAVAIDIGGKAFSWGAENHGQLGRLCSSKYAMDPPWFEKQKSGKWLTNSERASPEAVQSVSKLTIVQAACGMHHTMLLSDPDGENKEPTAEDSYPKPRHDALRPVVGDVSGSPAMPIFKPQSRLPPPSRLSHAGVHL